MKLFLAGLSLFLLLAGPVMAQDQEEGFIGPGTDTNLIKVSDLSGMDSFTEVTLDGYVKKKTDDELYQFTDGTGTIDLSVDDELWAGLTVSPDDLVEIQGELNKSIDRLRIDVKSISKINRQVIETTEPGAVVK